MQLIGKFHQITENPMLFSLASIPKVYNINKIEKIQRRAASLVSNISLCIKTVSRQCYTIMVCNHYTKAWFFYKIILSTRREHCYQSTVILEQTTNSNSNTSKQIVRLLCILFSRHYCELEQSSF